MFCFYLVGVIRCFFSFTSLSSSNISSKKLRSGSLVNFLFVVATGDLDGGLACDLTGVFSGDVTSGLAGVRGVGCNVPGSGIG